MNKFQIGQAWAARLASAILRADLPRNEKSAIRVHYRLALLSSGSPRWQMRYVHQGGEMRKIIVYPLTGMLGFVMALGLVMATGSQAQAAVYRMQIHEIYYNSPGPDYGGSSSLNHEWVQLHNQSDSTINLASWTLRDKAGHVFKFGSYTIKPHGYVTIHTGKGAGTQTDRYWNRSWYIWNNTGDTALLKNQNGTVIDQCSYQGTSQGYTYC